MNTINLDINLLKSAIKENDNDANYQLINSTKKEYFSSNNNIESYGCFLCSSNCRLFIKFSSYDLCQCQEKTNIK